MDYGRRQKIEEREPFTEEERDIIAAKSGHKCAHCGKPVYYGYGGTVDHYVPISLGGTNDMRNLFLMCKDCNEEKTDRVLTVKSAIPYADGRSKKKAEEYFDEYVRKFEYLDNHNLFKYDEYEISTEKLLGGRGMVIPARRFLLKRMKPDDVPMLSDYFAKYLKKNGVSGNSELCRIDMEFWMRTGAVYSMRDSEGMKLVLVATVCCSDGWEEDDRNADYELTISLFPYYSSRFWMVASAKTAHSFGWNLMDERGLDMLHIKVRMPADDPVTPAALSYFSHGDPIMQDRAIRSFAVVHSVYNRTAGRGDDLYEYGAKELEFFDSFRSMDFLAQKMVLTFHEEYPDEDINDYDWLLSDIRYTLKNEFAERHPELYDREETKEEGNDKGIHR